MKLSTIIRYELTEEAVRGGEGRQLGRGIGKVVTTGNGIHPIR
jgi:hypothetical protein